MNSQPQNSSFQISIDEEKQLLLESDELSLSYNALQEHEPVQGKDYVPENINEIQMLEKTDESLHSIQTQINESIKYEGDTNQQGWYHGKGQIEYIDGSFYDGSWKNGQKHGYGVYSRNDGYKYEGYWKNNKQNGEGKEFLLNNTVIIAQWDMGVKVGEGIIKDNNNNSEKKVSFYKDLMLSNETTDTYLWDLAPLNILLVLSTIVCVFGAYYQQNYFNVLVGIGLTTYLLQLIECAFSYTCIYVNSSQPFPLIIDHIYQNKLKKPNIYFYVKNYRYPFDFDSERERQTMRLIPTQTAKVPYKYSQWIDLSLDSEVLNVISKFKLIKLDFQLEIEYTPQARLSYDYQKYHSRKRNLRDKHFSFQVIQNFKGLIKQTLLYNGNQPWYINPYVFWIMSSFGLSFIVRILVILNSKRATFIYKKLIVH